ncbi:MAG TPA: hypothetical protein VFV50_00265 [Bdellovibrionales bacterium]|nr:hypothetical protein [Bdellovibrionales bacterium]
MKQAKLLSMSLGLMLALMGCATGDSAGNGKRVVDSAEPQEKIFKESFDDIWRAVQLAMANYPIKVNNQDSGVLETEAIRGDSAWVTPGQRRPPAGGFRYRVVIRVVRGRTEKNVSAGKVTILKLGEIQRDFFSAYEKLPSDGMEELAIMYRIERELAIDKAMRQN